MGHLQSTRLEYLPGGGGTIGTDKGLFLPSSFFSHEGDLRADPGGKEGKVVNFSTLRHLQGLLGCHWGSFCSLPQAQWGHTSLLGKGQSQDAGTSQLPRGTQFPLCIEMPICLGLSFPSESKRSVKAQDKAQSLEAQSRS